MDESLQREPAGAKLSNSRPDWQSIRAAVTAFVEGKASDLPPAERDDVVSDTIAATFEKTKAGHVARPIALAIKIANGKLANIFRKTRHRDDPHAAVSGDNPEAETLASERQKRLVRLRLLDEDGQPTQSARERWRGKLWTAVGIKEVCEEEFRRFAGCHWTDTDMKRARGGTPKTLRAREERARGILRKIHSAAEETKAFLDEPPPDAPDLASAHALRQLGPHLLALPETLLMQGEISSKAGPATKIDASTRNVIVATYRDWGFKNYSFFGRKRPPTDRELAIISLLCGNLPPLAKRRRKLTVFEIIEAEKKIIASAQRRWGARQTISGSTLP